MIDRVWKERKELEQFRNIERLANYQMVLAGREQTPIFFKGK